MTASTRRAVRPCEWASHSRWLRALRLGCSAAASSSEPTWLSGWPQAGVRLAADQRAAVVGGVQAEDHPHRGGLAGPVGADEPGDLARLDGERHPVQRQGRPELLAQAGDLDGRFHVRNAREAAAGVVTPESGLPRRCTGGGRSPRIPRTRDAGIAPRGDARRAAPAGTMTCVGQAGDWHGAGTAGWRRLATPPYAPVTAAAARDARGGPGDVAAVDGAPHAGRALNGGAAAAWWASLFVLALVSLATTLPLGFLWARPAGRGHCPRRASCRWPGSTR